MKKLRSIRVSDAMVEMLKNETGMALQEFVDSKIQVTLLNREIKQRAEK